jgi:nicotinamidase-related amidase
MPIDPKTTARLLIEYQNDFTSEGGALHQGVKAVMESANMLANSAQLATQARAAGVTVMFAPISFAKGYREITADPYGILKGVVDSNAFVRGTWGAAIADAISPAPEDIIAEGKRGLDTFVQHKSGLHPSIPWDQDTGSRQLPVELLCGIDRAYRLREGLSCRRVS